MSIDSVFGQDPGICVDLQDNDRLLIVLPVVLERVD